MKQAEARSAGGVRGGALDRKLLLLAPLVFLFTFTGPLLVYLKNPHEAVVGWTWFVPGLVVLAAATLLAVAGLMRVLASGGRARRAILAAFLGAAAVLWLVDGLGLAIGPLNGAEKYFAKFYWLDAVGAALVIGCALLAARSRFRFQWFAFAAILLLSLQAASVVHAAVMTVKEGQAWRQAAKRIRRSDLISSMGMKFKLSRGKNILVLVLDMMTSDVFADILAGDPGLRRSFKDFTFFKNAVGSHPSTMFAVPQIFTGCPFRNDRPFSRYLQEISRKGVAPELKQKGYEIYMDRFFPLAYLYNTRGKTVANSAETCRRTAQSVLRNVQAGALRFAPFCLKKAFYGPSVILGESSVSDLKILKKFDELEAVHMNPAFRYYHLKGPHPPFTYDSRWRRAKRGAGFLEGYREQAKGALRIAVKFLEKLKEQGVYDASRIVILGDHGISMNEGRRSFEKNRNGSPLWSSRLLSSALPMLIVKGANETHEGMKVSMEEFSYMELPALICGRRSPSGRGKMEAGKRKGERERIFYYYEWDHGLWRKDFLPEMFPFLVRGNASLIQNWRSAGYVVEAGGKRRSLSPEQIAMLSVKVGIREMEAVGLGEIVDLSSRARRCHALEMGFSVPESWGRWMDGEKGRLLLYLDQRPDRDLLLELNLNVFRIPGRLEQDLTVQANGVTVARWRELQKGTRTLVIPLRAVGKDRRLELKFLAPRAARPADFKSMNSRDMRRLSVGLVSLRFLQGSGAADADRP
ncbi:MAG: sulfatase-like hydrolase/transferase [Candidatus Aminicenantes bacterium]|nr:sulfatase-like hydrolase/transferase [Candidatus Aminicenantes bacterium]